MTDPNRAAAIQRSRELCAHGDYALGMRSLTNLRSQTDSLDLTTVAEIARVYIIQGNRKAACELLAVPREMGNSTSTADDLLLIQASYLGVSQECNMFDAVNTADFMWKKHIVATVPAWNSATLTDDLVRSYLSGVPVNLIRS
jgi:hypothetical protein